MSWMLIKAAALSLDIRQEACWLDPGCITPRSPPSWSIIGDTWLRWTVVGLFPLGVSAGVSRGCARQSPGLKQNSMRNCKPLVFAREASCHVSTESFTVDLTELVRTALPQKSIKRCNYIKYSSAEPSKVTAGDSVSLWGRKKSMSVTYWHVSDL